MSKALKSLENQTFNEFILFEKDINYEIMLGNNLKRYKSLYKMNIPF